MYCSQNNTTFLAADMDLHLINEDWGVVVDSSSSWTNNNEMLEYKNTSAPHWYRLKIKKYGIKAEN